MQELHERVRYLGRLLGTSLADIAKSIGVLPQTFNGYLKESRQNNLWPLLPEILKQYPRLSRQWLYFGEGPALIGMGIPLDQPVPPELLAQATHAAEQDLRTQVERLTRELEEEKKKREEREQELDEANRINRKLMTRLLIEGETSKESQPATGKASDGQK